MLIGLRTRELLQQLLEARCQLSPVVMVIEDLHWIDSVSEELLGKIVDSQAKLDFCSSTTRRPEYVPPWLDRSVVTNCFWSRFLLATFAAWYKRDLGSRLCPTRSLGRSPKRPRAIRSLPRRSSASSSSGHHSHHHGNGIRRERGGGGPASERAEPANRSCGPPRTRGSCAFASGLGDRKAVRSTIAGRRSRARPMSMPGSLRCRRLIWSIGRAKSEDYLFKHALVRDALYQSLLTDARSRCT